MKTEYRELLLRYLLGEMSTEESAQIELRLLREEEFADGMQEARADLLDAYVAGELGPKFRARVERAFEGMGAERALAEALRKGLARLPAPPSAGIAKRAQWSWQLAIAACFAVAAAVIAVSFFPGFRWGRAQQPGQVATSSVSPSPPTAAGNGASSLAREFVLLLSPDVLRGEPAVQTAGIPQNTATVKVQIIVPDALARYSVRVESRTGDKEATFSELTPERLGSSSFVQFSIPHAALRPEVYRFSVFRLLNGSERLSHVYQVQILAD